MENCTMGKVLVQARIENVYDFPLELLDFVVDPCGQQLIGNPARGGEHIIELY